MKIATQLCIRIMRISGLKNLNNIYHKTNKILTFKKKAIMKKLSHFLLLLL